MNYSLDYKTDILKNGLESAIINQKEDYEGKVICTIIRKKATHNQNKAVLYIHGFNDYFFQTEMADYFNKNGIHFYALDLRKYGRSHLPNQKLNNVRNLEEYFDDVSKALQIIKQEGSEKIILSGHSTGGLIASIYAQEKSNENLFNALFLNSPFFGFNINPITKNIVIPIVSAVGFIFPNILTNGGFSELYGKSLHKEAYGEWDYNLAWKPHVPPLVNLGFIKAVYLAQKKVKKGLKISVPVLVMHSDNSIYEKKWSDKMFTGDAILNINDIDRESKKILGNTIIKVIPNGQHDLILSPKPVRERVYKALFEWIENLS
jgi:alpha-beta hydrolase superfamily lysophospholipase